MQRSKTLNPDQCQKWIFSFSDFISHQCTRRVVVNYDGFNYCKIHDPEYIKAKGKARQEKWDREWAERRKRGNLEVVRRKATAGLTLDELNAVTPDLIRKALKEA